MEDNCPPTPLHVKTGRNSKSPNRMTVSSPDSDGMKSPSGRLSPDSRCVICLGKLQRKSFTDSCLHQFCFQCLLQWSKVKPECPLCKQPFKSIIHNVRSNFDYDQYHIERREPACMVSEILHSYDFDLVPVDRRFRYRSTMTREYFRELAEGFLARTRSSFQMPNFVSSPTYHIPPSPRFSQSHERQSVRGTGFRRLVYEQDLWVQDLVDITGRYRECTPEFYRDNPAQVYRIIPWLSREVSSLLNDNDSYTAYVLHFITGLLFQHPIRSPEFREAIEMYFGFRTDHFIHEFYTFARSVYDITGFDQNAVYVPNPHYGTEVQEIFSSSSDDSDIEVIESLLLKSTAKGRRSRRNPLRKAMRNRTDLNTHSGEPVPGPSGINSSRATEMIDVCESENDDIKVIDYVKPPPEVVVLSSGDDEKPTTSTHDTRHTSFRRKSHRNRSPDESSSDGHEVLNKKKFSNGKRAKRHKGLTEKYKHDGSDLKGKAKERSKESRNVSSSSSSTNYTTESSSFSINSTSSSDSTSTESGSSSSSSSDYEPLAKKRRKLLERESRKRKKLNLHKNSIKNKETKTTASSAGEKCKRKSKVKSCVVVPSTVGRHDSEGSGRYPANEASLNYSHHRRTDDGSSTSLLSYWSLALNNKPEKHRKRKRSKEKKSCHSSYKRGRQVDESSREKSPQSHTKKGNTSGKRSGNSSDSCNSQESGSHRKYKHSVKNEGSLELTSDSRLHSDTENNGNRSSCHKKDSRRSRSSSY